MGNNSDKFDWFGWEEDPLNKYKQPKPSNHQINGSGYPQTDIDMDGVMVKGRWPTGTKKKVRMDMRGAGAATRGKKFYPED